MPPRFILGLHSGHNASACIGDASGLIYAVQEERLTRRKELLGHADASDPRMFAAHRR